MGSPMTRALLENFCRLFDESRNTGHRDRRHVGGSNPSSAAKFKYVRYLPSPMSQTAHVAIVGNLVLGLPRWIADVVARRQPSASRTESGKGQ
jgi:hypothetical protein